MNLFGKRGIVTLALGIALVANTGNAQDSQDKKQDKKSKNGSGSQGSRSSGGSSGSSGSSQQNNNPNSSGQTPPARTTPRSFGDSPNSSSKRDSVPPSREPRSTEGSSNPGGDKSSQNNQKSDKSDKSVDSGQNPGRHLGAGNKDQGNVPRSSDQKSPSDSKNRSTPSASDKAGSRPGDNSKSGPPTTDANPRSSKTDKSGSFSDRAKSPRTSPSTESPTPRATLTTRQIANGEEKRTSSGQVRERTEKKSDGEHTRSFAPTGRTQKEVITRPNGSQETIQYASDGKTAQKRVEVARDGTRQTTSYQRSRGGERAETVKVDARGREVSKTVVVKNTTVIVKNTTIVHDHPIERHYVRAKYGFVYHPSYVVVRAPVFVSWYDPYWYGPSGVWTPHPFHYAWGWNNYGWYRCHSYYWNVYPVYPTPAYWVTDWMIAGYVADRYAAAVSAEQARNDAQAAREDAERAREAAEKAREQAEIAEARAAQSEAEARAAKAEALLAKAEAEEARAKRGEQSNSNGTPIDPKTKEDLRMQIEKAVGEKKEYAAQAEKGNAVPPDISKCLADPKHLYPVSRPINVISAVDQGPAGTLTEGDLLRLEPGQEATFKDADENTFVTMRVMSSKGEEGEAKAGTLVSVTLKTLQEFDSEFRAKLDLGLAEADKNKDQFKSGATKAGG